MVAPGQQEFETGDAGDVLNPPAGFYALWFDASGAGFIRNSAGVDAPLAGGGITPAGTLIFGARGISSTTTDRYLFPGYGDSTASTVRVQIAAPHAGTLKNLRVVHNVPDGNGNAVVYTVRVNGAPTSLSLSIPSTDAVGSNVSDSAAVSVGDLIDIIVTKVASLGTSPDDVIVSMEYT